jgi:hypothetical protein
VKRSHLVGIALLGVFVAALERCGGRRECIDQNNVVVDDGLCQNHAGGYRWFYTYSSGNTYVGSHVNPSSGTDRGVFGSTGDAAGHGGGEAGE